MDVNNWEAEVCQCCLVSQEYQKSLSGEHCWIGQKESYEEMLLHVFNITVQSNQKGLRICEDCVDKLRAAASFKKQVLQSQERLLNQIASDSHPKILKKEDSYSEDDNKESFEDTLQDADDNNSIENNDIKAEIVDQDTPTIKGKLKEKRTKTKKESLTEEKQMKVNTVILIKNSNMLPFKWHTNKYQCFCCKETFCDILNLRKHTEVHNIDDIERIVTRYKTVLYHKVEVTDLECKICRESQKSIGDFQEHLTHHGFGIINKDLLIPYKLIKNYQCAVCEKNFQVFHQLNIHMNEHYKNFICETCGSGFANLSNFKEHRRVHKSKVVICQICKLEFRNSYQKEQHDYQVHSKNGKRVCPVCKERFTGNYARLKHLIQNHGHIAPEHKCDACGKVFLRKYILNAHIRKFHMKEKKQSCSLCDKDFFNKSDYVQHLLKHGGAKQFSCNFCGKTYTRKKALVFHLKKHKDR